MKKISTAKLIKMLSSRSHLKRMQAATLLSTYDEQAVPSLLKVLGTPGSNIKQWSIRWYAAVALSWIGYKVIPFLSKSLLQDKDWHIRAGSVELFGMLRREEGIPYLIKSLNDEHFKVRKYSIFALRRIGKLSSSMIQKIKTMAKNDPHKEVRETAKETLRKLK